jgi:hypothetical protein
MRRITKSYYTPAHILHHPLPSSLYNPKTAAMPIAIAPYPTTLAPAPLAVCSGAADPLVAEPEVLAVRLPLITLVAADFAEPVAEPEEGRAVGTLEIVTPTAAQREDTAGARPVVC